MNKLVKSTVFVKLFLVITHTKQEWIQIQKVSAKIFFFLITQ